MLAMFQRSWAITKLTFRVIGQDKEMLLFPLFGGVFSLLFVVALLFPTVVAGVGAAGGGQALGALDYVILAVVYFGLAVIMTFFNTCVVYTTKSRFDGGDATFTDSLRFAWSKLPLVVAWAVISATVGLILRAVEALVQRIGGIGEIVLDILLSILGLAWSVVALFVIPGMVYRDLGPIEALKSAVTTLRRTWGESLVRHFGLGVIQFLFLLLGAGLGYVLFAALGGLGTGGLLVAAGVTAVYVLGVVLVFNVANTVFSTALYAYANGQALPADFDETTLRQALRPRRGRGRAGF